MERWKDIPGYEGYYQVSDKGRVKRVDFDRPVTIWRDRTGGYGYVALSKQSVVNRYYVHRLMMDVFSPDDGELVTFINGDKTDLRLENLTYVSRHQLNNDRDNKSSWVFANQDVLDILDSDDSTQELAERYGVCERTIQRVVSGKTYTKIYEEYHSQNAGL